MKNRYALLTVDTEALPKRAEEDHVRRLMWGEHEKGTAGVREMASIGNEFGAKHVFFVDMCGAYERADEIREVMAWLNADGQDVELHTHPEYLPDEFWQKNRFRVRPKLMNRYTDAFFALALRGRGGKSGQASCQGLSGRLLSLEHSHPEHP